MSLIRLSGSTAKRERSCATAVSAVPPPPPQAFPQGSLAAARQRRERPRKRNYHPRASTAAVRCAKSSIGGGPGFRPGGGFSVQDEHIGSVG